MSKIIEDIYCGRFSAVNRPIKRGSEYDRAISEVTRCEEALRGKLNPDAMKLLAAYSQACADLSGIWCKILYGIDHPGADCTGCLRSVRGMLFQL